MYTIYKTTARVVAKARGKGSAVSRLNLTLSESFIQESCSAEGLS
jgi:hypothetical protein